MIVGTITYIPEDNIDFVSVFKKWKDFIIIYNNYKLS
jgi:hypothetical protein